jgi:hypothetical protein
MWEYQFEEMCGLRQIVISWALCKISKTISADESRLFHIIEHPCISSLVTFTPTITLSILGSREADNVWLIHLNI